MAVEPLVPVTITLDAFQKIVIEEFYSQARSINPDVPNVDIENAFYNFMVTRFGGDVNDWTTLENPRWTIDRCKQAAEYLDNEGISDGLAKMYLGVKVGTETETEATGDMFEKGGDNNG